MPDRVSTIRRIAGTLPAVARARLRVARRGGTAAGLENLEHILSRELDELRHELASLRIELETTTVWAQEGAGLSKWLAERAEEDRATLQLRLEELSRRVPGDSVLGGEALGLETFEAPVGAKVVGFRGGPVPERDIYLGFENVFRGSEGEISQRQGPYLQLLRQHQPVLDLGCGRGELLERLRSEGVDARGVDLDPAMVARCREKGLEVVEQDALTALGDAPSASLGAVVAAQVIEHLPYPVLTAFVREVQRVLTPGGIAILETVNPHNPQALKHFWLDPSHQHPLFPEVVLTLLRLSGFAEGYVWHPQGGDDPDRNRAEQPDYVIVATNPPSPVASPGQ